MDLNKNDYELLNYIFKNDIRNWTYIKNIMSSKAYYEGSLSYEGADFLRKSIELMVRRECNQQCSYCYLTMYGNEIYPPETRSSNEVILKNIKSLFNYFLEKEIYHLDWEIFAGDLFYDDLFYDVCDLFYEYYSTIIEKEPEFKKVCAKINDYFDVGLPIIVMPSNLSCCLVPERKQKLQDYIDKFKKDLGVTIALSYSSDGPYSTDTREHKDVPEEDFDTILEFVSKNNGGCHPMIAACNIEHAIDNFDWWTKKMKQFYGDRPDFECIPSMLEVRNNDWTDEKIECYLKFWEHILQHRLKLCENRPDILAEHLFRSNDPNSIALEYLNPISGIDPLNLNVLHLEDNENSCNIGFSIVINCYNLGLIPCHRTGYPHFQGGHFVLDEDYKIIDLIPDENLYGYLSMYYDNVLTRVRCAKCDYKYFCMKGCQGAQYEAFGDSNIPIPCVCNLFQKKIDYQIKRYKELGVLDYIFNNPEKFDRDLILRLKELQERRAKHG